MTLNPISNNKLIGYNEIFLELKNLYDKNLLPNKIIFSGNSGIGKSTLAYHLINYIFSINEKDKYNYINNTISDLNNSYNLVQNNLHPNFYLITNDDNKSSIQVSKIREMINYTYKSSFNSQAKVILIDNIEYLNVNSINALLKVIEEPNDNTFFFLIHNNKIKILNTLNSRCIKFNLFLNYENTLEVINNLIDESFYKNLNNDFKNIYNSPGDILELKNLFKVNNIDEDISIEDLLKLIIEKSLIKNNSYLKKKLHIFIELYFKKNFFIIKSKANSYYLYKYFLNKFANCSKYNLDIESLLIEFKHKVFYG